MNKCWLLVPCLALMSCAAQSQSIVPASDAATSKWAGELVSTLNAHWVQPAGVPRGLKCKLKLVLRADGTVQSAKLIEGSGNLEFDRSALSAAIKSQPLPLPSDPRAFDPNVTIMFAPNER